MPINLIDCTGVEEGQKGKSLANLCKDEWEMPKQVDALEVWLNENGKKLPKGSYVADIGFSPKAGALGVARFLLPSQWKLWHLSI